MVMHEYVCMYFTFLAYAPKQINLLHHKAVPLHYYWSLHIDPTLLSIATKKSNF